MRTRRSISWLAVVALLLTAFITGAAGVAAPPTAAAGVGAALSGSVLGINDDPTGVNAWDDPLPGVRVAVFDAASGVFVKAADTDTLGRFTIAGLSTNAVKVRFTKTGWLTVWRPGTVTPVTGTTVDLGEHTIYAEAAVSGEVLSWMDPIGGARVTVFNAVTGAVLAAMQLGEYETTYRIGGLPAGQVTVRATKPGYLPATAGPYPLVAGQELQQSWDPMVLYLDMAPAVVLQGTVTGTNQAKGWSGPLGGVRVLLTNPTTGQAVAAVTTDAQGKYRFAQLAPQQTVRVRFSKPGWLTATYPQDVFLQAYTTPVELGTTTMQAAAAVSGQVLSQMDPIGGARVTVFNATTGAVITAVNADGDGNYRVGGLPAGPIKVRATKAGFKDAWADYPATKATAAVYTLVSGQQLQQSWDPVRLYLDLMPR